MPAPFFDTTETGFRRGEFLADGTFVGITVEGEGFTYDTVFAEFRPVSGTVTKVTLTEESGGRLITNSVTELNVTSVPDLYTLYSDWENPAGFFGLVAYLSGEKLTLDDGGETGLILLGDNPLGLDPNDWVDARGGNDFISSSDGDDLILGGNGLDSLRGGEGNDTLSGQNDDDNLQGQDGNDVLRGGRGNDVVDGGSGNDRVLGQAGDDVAIGGEGADTLNGGDGNDQLFGDAGNDRINGGAGDDQMIGGAGSDTLNGGSGNDVLLADDGDDRVNGGAGLDFLIAAGGADRMVGGADADTFGFVDMGVSGSADVRDFDPLMDLLAVQYLEETTAAEQFAGFLAQATQSGNHVVWSSSDGGFEATIRNLDLDDLTLANFIDVDGSLVMTL